MDIIQFKKILVQIIHSNQPKIAIKDLGFFLLDEDFTQKEIHLTPCR